MAACSQDAEVLLSNPKYDVCVSRGTGDISAALALRHLCFQTDALTGDAFDDVSLHVTVVNRATAACVAGFRMQLFERSHDIARSYSAQFYDLTRVQTAIGPMLDIGRFCVHPACKDPDVLRMVWAALASYVDRKGVRLLFGCSSFAGTKTAPYRDAFALLASRCLAPAHLAPGLKASAVYPFGQTRTAKPATRQALSQMPPLLRMYLSMGGWVSDHAVIDPVLNTLHVFTALDVAAIPPARKRVLRSVASVL